MAAEQFFDILDAQLPGGTFDCLDRTVVPDRQLYLTRISMDHLDDMFEYSQDDRLYRCFEFSPHKKLEDTKKYLQKLLDGVGTEKSGRKSMFWFLRLFGSGKVVGTIGLVEIDPYRESACWGYAISPAYWGQGFILEAQLLVMKYFFEDLKMHRLFGMTPVDNEAVLSSVAAAGCQREGVLRDYYMYAGGIRKDAVMYSLLAPEYFATKERERASVPRPDLTLKKIQQIVATVFHVPEANVHAATKMADIPQWDSLSHIVLMVQLEKALGIKLKPLEIAQATNINAILQIVNNGVALS